VYVDAHVHFWDLAREHPIGVNRRIAGIERDFRPGDLRPLCEPLGVRRVVLVQAAPAVAETRDLLRLAEVDPFIAAVVGWVDLAADGCGATLDALRASPKLAGVRAMAADVREPDWLTSAPLLRGARTLAARGLTLDLLARPSQLRAARVLLEAVPDVRAVLDHCGRPLVVAREWTPWADDIAALARLPNALCKLSGLIERGGFEWTVDDLRPYVDHLLDTFGPDRLMFASNWPIINLVGSYRRWWDALQTALDRAAAPAAARTAVFRTTAERFYGLDGASAPDRSTA
jgi:L-fuconolactonase